MYLVDTNVWLERLLDQVKSEEVGKFIGHMPSERLSITDFTFVSLIWSIWSPKFVGFIELALFVEFIEFVELLGSLSLPGLVGLVY